VQYSVLVQKKEGSYMYQQSTTYPNPLYITFTKYTTNIYNC